MVARYEFVYVIATLFCIVNTLIILSKLNYNVGSALEIRLFRRMSFSFIGFLVLEIIWILSISRIIPLDPTTGWILKMVDTMLIPLMVYYWFMYAMERFRADWIIKLKYRVIAAIPLVVMFILYVTSFKTGLVFKLTNDTFMEGPLIGLTGIVDNIYGISIIAYALFAWKQNRPDVKKDEYKIQIVFILLCTLGGITDGILTMTPVMPLMITLSYNYLFIHILEGQIFNDALTGLNNRRRADAYVKESIGTASPETPCYVFLMDVDDFKKVNDTYGHIEGDQALKTVANAMRRMAGRYKGLLSRWGGDEFMLVLRNQPELDPNAVMKSANVILKQIVKEDDLPYDLHMSVGYCKVVSKDVQVNDIINDADQMMYKHKKSA